MRYLGMSLGMAVALGYTAAFGTLMPPIFRGEFGSQVLGTHSGLIILGGVAICLIGIAVAGAAGVSKEREMSDEQKRASIKEFDLKKGLLGRDVLRNYERLLCLRSCRRRSDQGDHRAARHSGTCGKVFPCWSWCSLADSRRTSSGA